MKHFFDVGANIGQTFKYYLNSRPSYDGCTVWCIEPSPRHLAELLQTAREQSQRYIINVCPFGLGGGSASRRFYTKDDARGDSFQEYLATDHETQNVSDGYSIYSTTVQTSLFILSHTSPGDEIVLKLDCEGSEYEILETLLGHHEALARVKRVLVEWHRIGSWHVSQQHLAEEYGRRGMSLENWRTAD
jgi:FkbM family methyltransferase